MRLRLQLTLRPAETRRYVTLELEIVVSPVHGELQNDDFDVDLSSRPRSGAASPHRHSFDSDLRNYFRRERRHSLSSDGGDHEPRGDSGPTLFEFALNRYGVTLMPIVPQKEKEKLSLSKRKCHLYPILFRRSPLGCSIRILQEKTVH
jgi:hypothetical protein